VLCLLTENSGIGSDVDGDGVRHDVPQGIWWQDVNTELEKSV